MQHLPGAVMLQVCSAARCVKGAVFAGDAAYGFVINKFIWAGVFVFGMAGKAGADFK